MITVLKLFISIPILIVDYLALLIRIWFRTLYYYIKCVNIENMYKKICEKKETISFK